MSKLPKVWWLTVGWILGNFTMLWLATHGGVVTDKPWPF